MQSPIWSHCTADRCTGSGRRPVFSMSWQVADGAGGSKATKKKAHSLYGSHFKDEAEMAKLEAQKTHVTFDDSDDD